MKNQYEHDYLALLRKCLDEGVGVESDRTKIGTIQLTGQTLVADKVGMEFPTLTTRPTPFRIAFWETMMFLNGITDTNFLVDKDITIWQANTTREFLDARGLIHVPEGDMGKGYGFQWRNFGGDAMGDQKGVDQIASVLHSLENDPFGRRHLISTWNPQQLNQMALPPCHIINQYMMVELRPDDCYRLDSTFYMRSCDMVYGLPFNMQAYAFLNIAFADYLSHTKTYRAKNINVLPGKVTFMGGDCHIYRNQVDMVREQLERAPYDGTQLKLGYPILSFNQLLNLSYAKDVRIAAFKRHAQFDNRPPMAQ
jgi:thymidylate synthase